MWVQIDSLNTMTVFSEILINAPSHLSWSTWCGQKKTKEVIFWTIQLHPKSDFQSLYDCFSPSVLPVCVPVSLLDLSVTRKLFFFLLCLCLSPSLWPALTLSFFFRTLWPGSPSGGPEALRMLPLLVTVSHFYFFSQSYRPTQRLWPMDLINTTHSVLIKVLAYAQSIGHT